MPDPQSFFKGLRDELDELLNQLEGALQEGLQHFPTDTDVATQRQQLEVLERSSEQMEKCGITVPEEMCQLLLRLKHKVAAADAEKELVTHVRDRLETILASLPEPSDGPSRRRRKTRVRQPTTPPRDYGPLIREALIQSGGRAPAHQVRAWIEQHMAGRFLPGDLVMVPDGRGVTWWRSVQFQRYRMVQDGELKSNSPRGVWELQDN